jgi:alpha-2-macroglobulin
MKRKLAGIFLFSFLLGSWAYAADVPSVEFFSPQGTVKTVRQVAVRFSEAMVPFGDPRGLIEPFDVDCSEKGAGRWADGRNWVYDFERDLPAGIRCEFRLRPGRKALSGKEIAGQSLFSFSTGGPSIRASTPYEGSQYVDEEQIFILILDTEPDVGSVSREAFFSVEGIQDRIGVRLVEGKEREEIVRSRFGKRKPELPFLLLQSKQRFPSDTKVSLIWGKGVMSKTGVTNEADQILRFQTRKSFAATFHCERENPRAGCVPVTPLSLNFSASISLADAKKILLRGANGTIWRPNVEEDEKREFVNGVFFKGPFPEMMNLSVELPSGLKDDSGRSLINASQFPLSIRTDAYPPLAKFSARFGILEAKADPVLPVTLRNLEPEVKAKRLRVDKEEGMLGRVMGKLLNLPPGKVENVQAWLRKVSAASRERSLLRDEKGAEDFKVPKPMGSRAFEVVGIPLKRPGLYVVELESALLGASLLGSSQSMYVPTAVLVTNLSVHFKWGRESSLVWVTRLDTGDPVGDAAVTVTDCQEKVLWNGKTDGNGLMQIGISLPSMEDLPRCDYRPDHRDDPQMGALQSLWGGLFITARTSDDMAFVHSSWDEGIEPWRFQLPEESDQDPVVAHTVFDRTLLRAGETIHMKHLLRRHTTQGFSQVAEARRPRGVSIEHDGSEQKYEFPLKWDAQGISETTWSIPKEAKLGRYQVVLVEASEARQKKPSGWRGQREPRGWTSGTFRVEEFRIPLTKGTIQPPPEPLIKAREVALDLNVQYLAGGGASLQPVTLRWEIEPRPLPAFEGFDDFTFGNGPVKEGLVRRGEMVESEEEVDEEGRPGGKNRVQLPGMDLVLDRSGSARATLSRLPEVEVPKEIRAELEFKDPNGEIQTVSSRIPLWPSRYLVGIKPDSWVASKDAFKFHVAVVDHSGKPVSEASVKVDLFERKIYTHRKRLVGGFYAYDHSTETKRIVSLCEGKTDSKGLLICEVRSPVSGNVILQAESFDASGNRTVAQRDVWVAAKGEWWFEVGDHDRMDLLPEKKRYQPGEKAVFQVRMPFREATALVTVEREGVIEAWVKKISGKEPVLEVPIKGSYAPNVYVSALVVRGRVSGVQPTAMIDPGRPAYKLGIAEIHVGWKEHELKVNVTSDRKVYKVRQKAQVQVRVRTSDGKIPPAGSEVALAAVDEGLLELMPNSSWEILSAMMGRRGYGVHTATAQMQVIGKRHFGLKALAPGGGGGRQSTRELFDTLLLWKARLPLNANGEASIEIPLNDSITSFRIVAVASAGMGLFGTGFTSIQSTQDLMILSGLPPLVREGDRFRAGFTLRNTTDRGMEVEASAKVEGIPGPLKGTAVSLQPGEAREVGWEIAVPLGVELLRWELEVREKGNGEGDRIRVSQKVIPVTPVSTFQGTIAQVEREFHLSVERPVDALPGKGGVKVTFRPRISEGLSGVTDYMRKYPYTCMEQKISVAVALRDESLWKGAMAELPSYLDSDGLVKYFPACNIGSPVLTSYLIAIGDEAGWTIPQEIQEKMENGLIRFVQGAIIRYSPLPTADLSIRKLSAIEALSRSKRAEAKLLSSISIEPNLWPTSAVIDWLTILRNIEAIARRDERMREAEQILRSRLNFQGTTMGFSTEKTDTLWWLMISNDVNAVRAILALLPSERWREDMPRMVQGALARQIRGRWDLTLANAWGVLALEKFSKVFETAPVAGSSRATLATQSQTVEWKASPRGRISQFPWPAGREDLVVEHQGTGKPWLTVQSLAAIPLKEPFSSGYRVRKSVIPIERKDPKQWSRGDLLRIRLEMEAQADQTWVVVNDPVPAGSTILGSGLGRDSSLLTKGEERKGWVWPAFEERSFEAFRAYFEYVPKGRWTVEYTLRLNQDGLFLLPSTRVEALYFPEMLGEIPNRAVEVRP